MRYLGTWVLSFFFWMVVFFAESYWRHRRIHQPEAYSTGRAMQTFIVGWPLTGLFLFGLWCILEA